MTSPEAVVVPPTPGKTHAPARYPLLPHARPGGIAGLLEILIDSGGTEDLYHLAEKLLMQVDDLFPIAEAAVLLGFAWLKVGEVEINPKGQASPGADLAEPRRMLWPSRPFPDPAISTNRKDATPKLTPPPD